MKSVGGKATTRPRKHQACRESWGWRHFGSDFGLMGAPSLSSLLEHCSLAQELMDSSRTKTTRVLSQTKPVKVKLLETSQPLLAYSNIYDHQKANGSPFSYHCHLPYKSSLNQNFLLPSLQIASFSAAAISQHFSPWLTYFHITLQIRTDCRHVCIHTPLTFYSRPQLKHHLQKKPVNVIKIKTSSRFHYPCTDKAIRKHFLKYP